jgi:hypothetical protein
MKADSVLILLNDQTKKLYTLAMTTSRHQGVEQEKNTLTRLSPCYVAFGAICQWTYLFLITLST